MEVFRCYRCGAFFTNEGHVCAKCTDKENHEVSKFTSFIQENEGINSLNQISFETGIPEKNLNHFLNYNGLRKYKKLFKEQPKNLKSIIDN